MNDKIVFKSGVSLKLVVFLTVLFCGLTISFIVIAAWPGLLVIGLVILFIIHTFWNTYYTITPDAKLNIRCGLLFYEVIDISTIYKVDPSRTIISAPAFSFDRLEIFYHKFDSIIISPQNKAEFISLLLKFNTAIKIKKEVSSIGT